jgi:hypothetical protein
VTPYFAYLAGLVAIATLLAGWSIRLWSGSGEHRLLRWTGAALTTVLALGATAGCVLVTVALVAIASRSAPAPELLAAIYEYLNDLPTLARR